jgi:tetratricopeptide (TPR) repeat protein
VPLSHDQIVTLAREASRRAASGDFVGAEGDFARLVEAQPNSGPLLHFLGQIRLQLGRFAEAREPLQRAASFLPNEPAAHINLAGCLSRLGEHGPALAALERAARLKPNDPAIAYNRGRALEALGRIDEAERAYDEALAVDHRLIPALSARAALLAARGEWAGAVADLDAALVSRPDDARLRLRRAELLLRRGDWWRGLADYEARLDIAGERYAPDLPRWQGEPPAGRLLVYPEQADIDSDEAIRDTLMLARGVDAVVQCSAKLGDWLAGPTIRRGDSLEGFAAAAPLRSLPHLLGWTLDSLPPPGAVRLKAEPSARIGWFARTEPPAGIEVERDPGQVAHCGLVVGNDAVPTHVAARLGIPTLLLLGDSADWLWGPRTGTSPWYPTLEVLREDETEKLAARLGRC